MKEIYAEKRRLRQSNWRESRKPSEHLKNQNKPRSTRKPGREYAAISTRSSRFQPQTAYFQRAESRKKADKFKFFFSEHIYIFHVISTSNSCSCI